MNAGTFDPLNLIFLSPDPPTLSVASVALLPFVKVVTTAVPVYSV